MTYVVVEGATDIPLMRKVFAYAGHAEPFWKDVGGKSQIDPHIGRWVQASRTTSWVVLRDLDHDAGCAPSLVRRLLNGQRPPPTFALRIVERAVESWVLADAERLAAYLHIRPNSIPLHPDREPDPTRTLTRLAQRSAKPAIRRNFTPEGGAHVGPLYETCLIEFGTLHWRPDVAERRSPSLARCVKALRRLSADAQSSTRPDE